MEGDDGVHRSICCRQLLSADSRRSNGKPGVVAVAGVAVGVGGVSSMPVTT